jgi:OOP family OmpA-OmpF porin
VLPAAIGAAVQRNRMALTGAAEKIVSETLWTVARRDPDRMVEILAPSIGASVRKALSAAIQALMERFNEVLERSLSLRSIRWRVEARRTGRPFAEVVLLRTLVYRVEQVLLVHAPTGLVLQHVVAEGLPSADPDQVASMLDALDSFSREAFKAEPAGSRLHDFSVGDLKVWADWGHSIAIVAVVRGLPPPGFASLVRETRERVYVSHHEALAAFVSDVTPFATTREALEAVLLEQRQRPHRRAQILLAVLGLLLTLGLASYLVGSHRRSAEQARQLAARRDALSAVPGLVVTSAQRSDGHYRLAGFRDPLAPSPQAVLAQRGYPPADLDFTLFQSLDPQIVARRAREVLQPPAGADVRLVESDTLRVSGVAPSAWIARTRMVAPALPGVARVDASDLRASEAVALDAVRDALQEKRIYFAPGSSRPDSSAQAVLAQAAQLAARLRRRASELGSSACITVVGSADSSGSVELNQLLARERAVETVKAMAAAGVDPASLRARGDDVASSRSAGFLVELLERGAGCGEQGKE